MAKKKSPKPRKTKTAPLWERASQMPLQQVQQLISASKGQSLLKALRAEHTRRVKRLQASGFGNTLAVVGFERKGGRNKKSPAKMTERELLAEIGREQSFIKNKTSSVQGAREARSRVQSILDRYGLQFSSPKEESRMWRMYEEFKATHPDWSVGSPPEVLEIFTNEYQKWQNSGDTDMAKFFYNVDLRLKQLEDPMALFTEQGNPEVYEGGGNY